MGALYREFVLKNKCLHGMNAQLTDMGVLVPDHLVVVRTRESFLDCIPVHADCGGGIGTNYCTAGPNAVAISAQGSDSVAANNFTLHAETAPTQSFGLFFYGASELNAPLGQGTLCVGGVARLNPPLNSGNSGHFDRQVDFTAPPSPPYQILPGQTWNFQIWFRDGGNSDLSDALKVTFQP